MSDIITRAKEYLRASLSVIPTNENKLPRLETWKPYQSTPLPEDEVERVFNTAPGVAIICGAVSGGLEVIDVDTKYDITGTLWEEYSSLLRESLPGIYPTLVIAQTRSGGYHIYYRCTQVEGNLKLASRYTTPEERAEKPKDGQKILIETRGEGGYVVAEPTSGYKFIQGSPKELPTISPQARETILTIARSLTELDEVVVDTPQRTTAPASYTGLSPWEDYNSRGDVLALLEAHGWSRVSTRGERVYLKHGNGTDSKQSGNYHTGLRVLRVFSSSTEFSPDKGYSPSQVFSLLECGDDPKQTYRRLLEEGYGEPYNSGRGLLKTGRIQVNSVNGVNTVISEPGNYLSLSTLKEDSGEEVIIYPQGEDTQEDVLQAIEFIQTAGKRVYINLGRVEVREYKYQLKLELDKLQGLQAEKGGLTDRDIDTFLEAVVRISKGLDPIDKDVYNHYLLKLDAIRELGITPESLSVTQDRIATSKAKEAQATEFTELLDEAKRLQDSGNTSGAIKVLQDKLSEVKLRDKSTEFSKLFKEVNEEDIIERYRSRPASLESGYTIGKDLEKLLLPSGGITVFSAPTSHGKTALLINLALNTATLYPDKQIYFFSYEEEEDAVLLKALNTYQDEHLSANNRRSLEHYYRTGSLDMIRPEKKDSLLRAKDKFFNELVKTRRLNVHYTSYNSDTLVDAIRYINKHGAPGAIFIDYIQLISLPSGKYKAYSRQEEMKQICIALKDVAVETGLPIILGAQFNREVTSPLRIHTSKIGEAGDIERIANVIVGLYNNQFKYVGTNEEKEELAKKGITEGSGTIYAEVLKNRDGGKVGTWELWDWEGNTGRIENKIRSPKAQVGYN